MFNNNNNWNQNIIPILNQIPTAKAFYLFGLCLISIASLGGIGNWVNLKSREDRVISATTGLLFMATGYLIIERQTRRINEPKKPQEPNFCNFSFVGTKPPPLQNWGSSSIENPEDLEDQDKKMINILGYFYIEQDGQEEILVNQNPTSQWDLPIFETFNPDGKTIEDFIEESIERNLKKIDVDTRDILKCGICPPTYYKIYLSSLNSDCIDQSSYFFCKIQLQNKFEIPQNLLDFYSWRPKYEASREWESIDSCSSFDKCDESIFRLITQDLIYEYLGLKVLECTDSLIFMRSEKGLTKFLLLHRRIPKDKIDWEYVKGGIFYHETPLEGALREIKEETGIISKYLESKAYLGWQCVDVSIRNKGYDTLRVHGYAFEYKGSKDNIDLEPHHNRYEWMTFNEAVSAVKASEWIEGYAPEFFSRCRQKLIQSRCLNKEAFDS